MVQRKIQALEADTTVRKSSALLFPSCLTLVPFCACLLNYEESLLCRVTTGMKWDEIYTAPITGLAHEEPQLNRSCCCHHHL